MRSVTGLRISLAAGFFAYCTWSAAQVAPSLSLVKVGEGFSRPVFAVSPPGDTNRLFILEQHSGRVRILNLANGAIQPQPFLTVTGLTTRSEQGLLGLAFHPGYSSNGNFYVNYTTTGGGPAGQTQIARYQAVGDPTTSNTADPQSKLVLLSYPQPEENHNAGWLGFGLDGFLYISSGDGGGGNDQHGENGNGQDLNTLLGKILRIDVDGGAPYSIPPGNPFRDGTGREEIWALGLRNPWRCSIDRLTGDLWIADVGQNAREEINVSSAGTGGLNFGWRPREGLIQNPSFPNENPITPATDPIHDYGRSLGVSVTGGYVYRGASIPNLRGTYFFGDFGSGRVWTLRYDGSSVQDVRERTAELNSGNPRPIGGLASFGEDANGELYVCDLSDGEVYKIVSAEQDTISLSGAAVSGNVFSFQFTAAPGQSYLIEAAESLPPAWQSVTNLTLTGPSAVIQQPLEQAQRFYRVRTQ